MPTLKKKLSLWVFYKKKYILNKNRIFLTALLIFEKRPQNRVWHNRKQSKGTAGVIRCVCVCVVWVGKGGGGVWGVREVYLRGSVVRGRGCSYRCRQTVWQVSRRNAETGNRALLAGQRLYKSQEQGSRLLTFSPDPRRLCPLPLATWLPVCQPLPRWLASWCNCWPLCFRCFCWWGNLLRCTKEDKFHTHTQVLSTKPVSELSLWSFLKDTLFLR